MTMKQEMEDLKKTKFGSVVVCDDQTLLKEEAPFAYKRCEDIIDDLVDANLVRVVCVLQPVLTYKCKNRV